MRAAIYVRVAAENAARLDLQEDTLREFARESGYDVVRVERDTGSGLDPDRPGLQRLMQAADAGEFEVLLTPDPTRLYRNLRQFLDLYNHFRFGCGVVVLFTRYAASLAGGDV